MQARAGLAKRSEVSPARSYRAVLERVEEIAPETRAYQLRLQPGGGMTFRPGQFISLGLPLSDRPLVRPYSLASDPANPELLEICLNLVPGGRGSAYLFGLEPGAGVDFTGPWGSFVVGDPPPERCVFIAQGTGVAAERPMIRALVRSDPKPEVRLIHAAVDERQLLYGGEFEASLGADYIPLVEGENDGAHVALLDHVRRQYVEGDASRDRHFFVCGIGDVVLRLRDLLRSAGYERRAVHYEKW